MENNKSIRILAVLFLLVIVSCKNKTVTSEKTETKIKKIEVIDSTEIKYNDEYSSHVFNYNEEEHIFDVDLVRDSIINKAIENSNYYYYDKAILLLEDNRLSQLKKRVVILSMCSVSLEKRANLLEQSFKLFDKNELDEDNLFSAISMNHYIYKDNILVENYTNEKVITVLKTIKTNNKISKNTKRYIEDVLSGKAYENLKKMIKENR